MILEILSWLVILPAAALCLFPMHNQLKYSFRRTILLLALSLVILILPAAWLTKHFSLGTNDLFFIVVAIFYLIYHRCLNVPFCKSLSVFLAVVALLSILSNLTIIFDAMNNPSAGINILTAEYVFFQLIIVSLTAILLFHPLWKQASKLIDLLDIKRVWYATIPITISFCFINLFLQPLDYQILYENRIFSTFLICLILMLVIYLFLVIFFYYIVVGILDAVKIKENIRFLEMQESQFISQKNYMDATARERHDFRQSIHTLLGLYETGDYQSMGEFLKNYEQRLPRNEVTFFCKNNAFNALLNYYAHLATQCGVTFQLDINLPEKTPISDVDLCNMVGNILENAFHAAQKVDNGWVLLAVRPNFNDTLYIVATNSFDGIVRQKGERYLSTQRKGNGLGLASIISTARQYGGNASFSHKDKEFYSNIQIPLHEI